MENPKSPETSSEISSEISPQSFPELDRWIDLTAVDLFELRMLWFLFPDKRHTKSQIASELKLWEQQVSRSLERLRRVGFLFDEYISFGVSINEMDKTIRIYQLSEMGKFLLYQMETQFPGLVLYLTADTYYIG